ncbi:dTDP-glucose 4,6-dehydratase [Prosthecobacter sp. SYSU 5D2]|uniref:dTDP-glucose 4,6-dehydratase n=1 Tax=Prosthecobacter sp. SYSU 5D2 TaxID=3134134 RepID=UPI0031FE9B98
MNLLITGGAGFIGSHLIRHIIDRPEVQKLVNLDALTYAGNLDHLVGIHGQHLKYTFEQVDLRERAAVHQCVRQHQITHVIHLAAESHVDRSIQNATPFMETNVLGTHHLLDACRAAWGNENSGHRFIHVSTDEVYGSLGPSDPPFTEESPLLPNSPYSASKAAADCVVRSYHSTYGFPAIITRSCNNYGPHQHPEKLIPTVLACLRDRRPIPVYGDGRQIREWLHVSDHAEALWQVLLKGRAGEVYNIGSGQEWQNVELVEQLCDLWDEEHPAGTASRVLIDFVIDRPGHDWRYALNVSKITESIGWRPEIGCVKNAWLAGKGKFG